MPKVAPTASGEVTIEMKKGKDCKHSIRYEAGSDNAVVSSVYLDRKFSDPMPDSITVTITAG